MANGMNLNRWLALAAKGSTLRSHSLVTWFLLSNLLTFVIYGMDKMLACKAWRRVPEFTLLIFCFVGG